MSIEFPQRIRFHRLSSFNPRIDKEGKTRCLNCDGLLPRRRRRYCSDKCTRDFYTKHNWGALRVKIIRKSDYICVKCGFRAKDMKEKYAEELLVVDHIIPIFAGGDEFDEDNLQVLCKECNAEKTAKDLKYYWELRRGKKEKDEIKQLADSCHKISEWFNIASYRGKAQ